MADEQQLAVLWQGSDSGNGWREQNPDIRMDLSEADLVEMNLSGLDLAGANLTGASSTARTSPSPTSSGRTSVPAELQAVVPHLRSVPVQPLLRAGAPEYALFTPLKAYPWVLELFEYRDIAEVTSSLDRIISPREARARELLAVRLKCAS